MATASTTRIGRTATRNRLDLVRPVLSPLALAPEPGAPEPGASNPGVSEPGASNSGAAPAGHAWHSPVLLRETMAHLAVAAGKTYIDGTLGEGGHTERILQISSPDGVALGIDRDPRSVAAARGRLAGYGARATIVHGNYADMAAIAAGCGIAAVDGVLLDLGFSSRQIDREGYGLSFQSDEPLDMRYDPVGDTAADLVNATSEAVLADIIFRFGEERRSRRIARHIARNRPILTTGELARVVAQAVGGRVGSRHPATRTFQALRIAVNRELEHLEAGLAAAAELLHPGGRLVVISYHSLEDRLVKRWVERETASCVCPPQLPVCVCHRTPRFRAVSRRALRPSADEIAGNPRSRSALLRVVERL